MAEKRGSQTHCLFCFAIQCTEPGSGSHCGEGTIGGQGAPNAKHVHCCVSLKKNPASLRQKAPLSLRLWILFEETTQAENFVFLFCFLSPFIYGGGLKLKKNTNSKANRNYKNGMLFCALVNP